jgi:hypothetical protein
MEKSGCPAKKQLDGAHDQGGNQTFLDPRSLDLLRRPTFEPKTVQGSFHTFEYRTHLLRY